MVGVPIVSNRLSLPPGYAKYASVYTPWNGYSNGINSPAAVIIGSILDISASGAPADLSSFTIHNPGASEESYQFQFVYNGSVQTQGIGIPLPNSGASTAAQVITAIATVMNQVSGTDIDNNVIPFPWTIDQVTATELRVEWKVNGNSTSFAFPTGITITTESQPSFSVGSLVPGSLGKLGAALPAA